MRRYNIFISFRSSDKSFANTLKNEIETKLEDLRVKSFLSAHPKDGTTVGKDFYTELFRTIERSSVVVLILSNNWIQSPYCQDEYRIARYMGKTVLPIVINKPSKALQDFIDKKIGASTYASVSDDDEDHAIEKLIKSLRKDLIDPLNKRQTFRFEGRNPYKGLLSYEIADAAVYFGRDQESQEMLRLVEQLLGGEKKCIVIHGFSGAGKSSFMKAGVSAWMRFDQTRFTQWRVLSPFRPGNDATANLNAVLSQERITLSDNNTDAIVDALRSKFPGQKILLAVDQFEELFKQEKSKQAAFIAFLRRYLQTDDCYVMLTIRTEYLDELGSITINDVQTLGNLMREYHLKAIDIARIDDIIRAPMREGLVDMKISNGFVDALKRDIIDSPQALPLLSLYLYETFEKTDGIFTGDIYRAGDIFALIDTKANEALKSFDETAIDAFKHYFISQMLYIDPFNQKAFKRKTRLPEEQTIVPIIDEFVNARLFVRDGDRIEVAHEAIFAHWTKAEAWIEEHREFLIIRQKVRLAYEDWIKHNRSNDALLSGVLLEGAKLYTDKLDKNMRKYIDKSHLYQQRKKRKIIVGTIFAFIAILSFGIIAYLKKLDADANAAKAYQTVRKLDQALTNSMGLVWQRFVEYNIRNNHIENLQNIRKTLQLIDTNSSKKKEAITILTSYLSAQSATVLDQNITYNKFDAIFSALTFLGGQDSITLMQANQHLLTWYSTDLQLCTLSDLLDIILDQNAPSIFGWHNDLDKNDTEYIRFAQAYFAFVCSPSQKQLNTLKAYTYYKHTIPNNKFSVLNIFEYFAKVYQIIDANEFDHEFTSQVKRELFKNISARFINIYRQLYQDSIQHPTAYTEEEKETIEENYTEGLFLLGKALASNELNATFDFTSDVLQAYQAKQEISNTQKPSKIEALLKHILSIQNDNYFALTKLAQLKVLQDDRSALDLISLTIQNYPSKQKELENTYRTYKAVLDRNFTKLDKSTLKRIYYLLFKRSYIYGKEFPKKAVGALNDTLSFVQRYHVFDDNATLKQELSDIYGSMSWYKLFYRDFNGTIHDALKAYNLDKNNVWVLTNLSHALLLSGDTNASETYAPFVNYMKFKNNTFVSYIDFIKDDFKILNDYNVTDIHFANIEKWISKTKNFHSIYIDFNNNIFDVPYDIFKFDPELIKLILSSKALETNDEKQYWFNLLPLMTEKQIDKLKRILIKEKTTLKTFDNLSKKIVSAEGTVLVDTGDTKGIRKIVNESNKKFKELLKEIKN